MLEACGPFGPWVTSNVTRWFSFRDLKPLPWIAEKCAKRSLPPSSGVMKPNPFASLNHFTVPVAMLLLPFSMRRGQPSLACGHDDQGRELNGPLRRRLRGEGGTAHFTA